MPFVELAPTKVSTVINNTGWVNPAGALVPGSPVAVSAAGVGERLGLTGFNSSLWPDAFRIDGIEVIVQLRIEAGTSSFYAELSVDGRTPAAPTSQGARSVNGFNSTSFVETTFGSPTDNWAYPFTPKEIQGAPFTVILYGSTGHNFEVDGVVVRVHFTVVTDDSNDVNVVFGPSIPHNIDGDALAFIASPGLSPDTAVAVFSADRYVRENYAHLRNIPITPGILQESLTLSGGYVGTNLLNQTGSLPGAFNYPFPSYSTLAGQAYPGYFLNTPVSVDGLHVTSARSWVPLVRPGVIAREYVVPSFEKTAAQDPTGCAWFMNILNPSTGQPLVKVGDRIILIYSVPEHLYGTLQTDSSTTYPGVEIQMREITELASVIAPTKLSVAFDPRIISSITVNGTVQYTGDYDSTDTGDGYIRRVDRKLKTIDLRDGLGPDDKVEISYLTPADFYLYRGYRDRNNVFFPFDANPEYGHITGDPYLGRYRSSSECLFEKTTLYLIPSAIAYVTITDNPSGSTTDASVDIRYYSAYSYGESHFVRHLVGQQDELLQPRGSSAFLNLWGQAVLGKNYYDEQPTSVSDVYSTTIPSMMPIATLTLAAPASVNSVSVADARIRGGGVPEDFPMTAVTAQEDGLDRLRTFLDLGNWDGKAIKEGGVAEIKIERSFLKPLGLFTEDQITGIVRAFMPPGIDYDIVFEPTGFLGFDWSGSGGGNPTPPAPTNVIAIPGNAEVVVSWSPSSGAIRYNVKRADSIGGPYSTIATVTTLYYQDSNPPLTNGQTYFYEISALNVGESPNSDPASATPQAAAINPPSDLTAVPGDSTVTLNWTGVPGALFYTIYRSDYNGGPYTGIGTTSGPPYTNSGLANGHTYYYVVTVTTLAGESVYSNQAVATPNTVGPTLALRYTGITSPNSVFAPVMQQAVDEAVRLQFDGVRMHFSFTSYAATAPVSGVGGWSFTPTSTYMEDQVTACAAAGLRMSMLLYFGPNQSNATWKAYNGGNTWDSPRRPPSGLWLPMAAVYQDVITRVRNIYASYGLDPDVYVQFEWWNEPGKGGNGGPHNTSSTTPNDSTNYDPAYLPLAYGTWDDTFHQMSETILPRLNFGGSFVWAPALECQGTDFEQEIATFYNPTWMQYVDGFSMNIYRSSSTQQTIQQLAANWSSRADYIISRVQSVVGPDVPLRICEMGFSKAGVPGLDHEERGEVMLLAMDYAQRKQFVSVTLYGMMDANVPTTSDSDRYGLATYDGSTVSWYAADLPFARRVLGPSATVPSGSPIY